MITFLGAILKVLLGVIGKIKFTIVSILLLKLLHLFQNDA